MPRVEMNGIETFYHDYGSGQPLVVLHGATADHQAWAEKLQPLTEEYRVLLYDLRGHGKTGESNHGEYSVELYADDLAAFIDALDLDDPVVLGHSLGGMIGYAFADDYPEKLSKLITVGAATPRMFSTREKLIKTVFMRITAVAVGRERLRNGLVWAQEQFFGDDSTPDRDELGQIRASHGCDVPEPSGSEQAKILDTAQSYFGSEWSWGSSDVPVLMLYGENEPMIEPHAEFLEREFADCRSVEVPDASHNAQVDNPTFITEQVRQFLATEPQLESPQQ